MAKKSANPADAYRKALKAKELKKNKEARKSARDSQTVKRDTREIESEIKSLKSQGKLDAPLKSRLEALEKELKYVTTTKENYVKAHPEARDKVFKQHHASRDGDEDGESGPSDPNGLYGPDGKLRDPTRSVYYDPVYNPYGVPPPGMPYRERTPEESEDEDEDDLDDDIVMPDGRPPGNDSDSDDSDDIPLPEGPPPGSAPPLPLPTFTPTGPSTFARPPPPPMSNSSWGWGDELNSSQPVLSASKSRPPRPPPSHPSLPSRPPPFASLTSAPTGPHIAHDLPLRPTPPGSAVISSEPTKAKVAKPSSPSAKTPDYSAAAISAAPVMRDLRKEATAFVPRGVKRKQAAAPGGVSVNAAPGGGVIDEDGDERRVKQKEDGGGLMGRLQGVLGTSTVPSRSDTKGEADDEYQKFLEGLGDIA